MVDLDKSDYSNWFRMQFLDLETGEHLGQFMAAICDRCGAVVTDDVPHDRFHRQVEDAVPWESENLESTEA